MVQLNGYYIYYEKNSQMQTYMIERNQRKGQETSEKVEDKAVRNFRKIIDSKKPEEREEEKTSVFSYAATVCLALAVLVAGVNFYRNQQENAGIPEDFRETSAAVAQMTPVITAEEIVTQTETPTPTARAQNREKITSTENKRETYVIRPGDTLYQISLNRYGTVEAMEQICALNGISANEIIYPGQVIVLP